MKQFQENAANSNKNFNELIKYDAKTIHIVENFQNYK